MELLELVQFKKKLEERVASELFSEECVSDAQYESIVRDAIEGLNFGVTEEERNLYWEACQAVRDARQDIKNNLRRAGVVGSIYEEEK